MNPLNTIEHSRLETSTDQHTDWKKWGPYLSERAWGNVREDYSENGTAWEYLPHDHARSRAYRWSEDGLGGICDRHQILCFALALWNGKDPILKERLFGLTGNEGNHGEDVKEYYFYLDSTPTHSYLKMLYKYPQAEFPYARLVEENRRRDRQALEYELLDTGVFNEDRYFDVAIEYAKVSPDDILIKISITNRGPEAADVHILPQLWFRNTWSWGRSDLPRPQLRAIDANVIHAHHTTLGERWLYCASPDGRVSNPPLLFTENETNKERLWGAANDSPYVKDGIHEAVVNGKTYRVNPVQVGTKCAAHYQFHLEAGQTIAVPLRLADQFTHRPFNRFEAIFAERLKEADEFYAAVQPAALKDDERSVQRQAFAGLLWSKQWYHYDVDQWLKG
ncbi:MAG TPA: glucosidase, partial [Anaerolineae bacterium]